MYKIKFPKTEQTHKTNKKINKLLIPKTSS